jgi:hypothetical protein
VKHAEHVRPLARLAHELDRLRELGGHRLLDHHVLARAQRGHRLLEVH